MNFGMAAPESPDHPLRRELRLLALYRMLEATLLACVVFAQFEFNEVVVRNLPVARAIAVFYVVASVATFVWARYARTRVTYQAVAGISIDILTVAIVVHAVPSITPTTALLLLVNLGAASLFLPLRWGLFYASLASLTVFSEQGWSYFNDLPARPLVETTIFAASFVSMAVMCSLLAQTMYSSRALALRRGKEVADLAAINQLIIHRMRTGVLMIDADRRIQLANEAAVRLLGDQMYNHGNHRLIEVSRALTARFERWNRDNEVDETPLAIGPERAEVLPRFAKLTDRGSTTLIFLDDASVVSRRAESLTVSAMGRFSASLAHEIRNPLAAISYATQLLEESKHLNEGDRRLLDIINQQCKRTNAIVESVLGLARRERANAELIEISRFVRRFISDFTQTTQLENDQLKMTEPTRLVYGLFDPAHLQQVLTVLVQNALNYGRKPGEYARITLVPTEIEGHPTIDVNDRGPGVPAALIPQLGRPFYTTSEHGTGLGLYIARELCRANSASLEYVPVPGGGACFRITLSSRSSMISV